jgi:tryprostatin B 6-hydroxylase
MNLAGGTLNLHIAARSLLSVVGSAVLAGFLSHVLVFIHGEWDIYAHLLALGWAILHAALFLYFSQVEELSWTASLKIVGLESASYAIGLFGSIITYRVFFHRLRKFPGPFFAALTGFWALKEYGLEFKWFRKVERLHKTYGDFVRVSTCNLFTNPLSCY